MITMIALILALTVTAASAAEYSCIIYARHDCSTATVIFRDFPDSSVTRVSINGSRFQFSGTQARFGVPVTEILGVEAHTLKADGRVKVNARTYRFDLSSCVTPAPPPSPPPPTATEPVKIPVKQLAVTFGPWHGDPLVNIRVPAGTFTILGGDKTLHIEGPAVIRDYHVLPGHTVRVFEGQHQVAHRRAP